MGAIEEKLIMLVMRSNVAWEIRFRKLESLWPEFLPGSRPPLAQKLQLQMWRLGEAFGGLQARLGSCPGVTTGWLLLHGGT